MKFVLLIRNYVVCYTHFCSSSFLGVFFSKLQKFNIIFVTVVCPHATAQLHWTDFLEIQCFVYFSKIQVLSKSDENNGYFTQRHVQLSGVLLNCS
jgi:hypothetical protein